MTQRTVARGHLIVFVLISQQTSYVNVGTQSVHCSVSNVTKLVWGRGTPGKSPVLGTNSSLIFRNKRVLTKKKKSITAFRVAVRSSETIGIVLCDPRYFTEHSLGTNAPSIWVLNMGSQVFQIL